MDDSPDVDIGQTLLDGGWRQCSVFRPADPALLPSYLMFDSDAEYLLVATQACSLCGRGPSSEAMAEVIVARPVASIDARDPLSRGNVVRRLHLPLEGLDDAAGLHLDMGRRAFLPRESLIGATLIPTTLAPKDLRAFQAWMTRYYARIAMPDALVTRIKNRKAGIAVTVRKILEHRLSHRGDSYTVASDITRIYAKWRQDRELGQNENYDLHLVFVCRQERTKEYLLEALAGLASGLKGAEVRHGIIMDEPDVQVAHDLRLADVEDMYPYNEWDDLSQSDEIARAKSTD